MNIEKVLLETTANHSAAYMQKKFDSIDFACKVSLSDDDVRGTSPNTLVVEVEDPSRDVEDLVCDKLEQLGINGYVEKYTDNNDTVSNWQDSRFTYRKVLEALQKMTPEQLDSDATLFDEENDEYIEIKGIGVAQESDVLEKFHPFFILAREL